MTILIVLAVVVLYMMICGALATLFEKDMPENHVTVACIWPLYLAVYMLVMVPWRVGVFIGKLVQKLGK
jgi:hypothetical protein